MISHGRRGIWTDIDADQWWRWSEKVTEFDSWSAREHREPLAVRRGSRHGARVESGEVGGRQDLLGDLHSVERRVRREIGRRAVVVDEAHEPRVLHPPPFGLGHGPQDALGDIPFVGERHLVVALGDLAEMMHRRVPVAERIPLIEETEEDVVHLAHKGVLAERIGTDFDDAFRHLRATARSERRPIAEVAGEVAAQREPPRIG